MTIEDLKSTFIHRDGNLYRKQTTKGGKPGAKLGCDSGYGYIRVYFKGKRVTVHKIIWMMHNGKIPTGMQIDHINGIRNDNRLENLRLVTNKENHRNKKKPKTNTSGHIGVSWKSERNKWAASIFLGGKSGNFLGYFDNIEDAIARRKQAELEYGFHPNHGR
jgi:hypothetical protein